MTQWCPCGRRILTTEQESKVVKCDICQREHADSFKARMEALTKEGQDGLGQDTGDSSSSIRSTDGHS